MPEHEAVKSEETSGEGWGGELPPLEVWEKAFVNDAEFLQSTHGKVGCVICHGGDSQNENKELAHAGLVADPSEGTSNTCTTCYQVRLEPSNI